jgi:hypothetical protein
MYLLRMRRVNMRECKEEQELRFSKQMHSLLISIVIEEKEASYILECASENSGTGDDFR